MSSWSPPAPKSNGQPLDAVADYDALIASLAAFLNGGNLGDANFSSDPAQALSASKVNFGVGINMLAHHARHEPGGADKVIDIDILGTGTLLSAHASRHAEGGADAIPPGSLNASVLKTASLSAIVDTNRATQESFVQNVLALVEDVKNPRIYALSNSSAALAGRGVIRGGALYMAATGPTPKAIAKIVIDTATETLINLATNDIPRGLVLIGPNIYILCGSGGSNIKIKKLDANDVLTTVVDLNSTGATLTTAYFLRPNGTGTKLFCIGSDGATAYFVSVNVDGTSLVKFNTGSGNSFDGLAYAKRGSEEKLWTIDITAGNLLRRNIDLTADATLAVGTSARRLIYDGEHCVVGITGGAVNHLIVDPWGTMRAVMQISNPSTIDNGGLQVDDLSTEALADTDLFDGRCVHFLGRFTDGTQWTGDIRIYPADGYRAIDRRVSDAANRTPGGIACDGTYLYETFSNSGASTTIRRSLRL